MRQYKRFKSNLSELKKFAVICLTILPLSSLLASESLIADSLSINDISATNLAHTVKGVIKNSATKEGFAGIRVSVVNTRITTMTDEKGEFELRVPSENVTLSLDAPGFQDQLIAVKGRSYIDAEVLLKTGTKTSFYETSPLSPANQVVLSEFSPVISIDEDVTSRLSGDMRAIPHSGFPASGSSFFIGGLKSLNINAQPLFIVDGVIWQTNDMLSTSSVIEGYFNNPLSLIDPKDIEEIKVLKDGLALYGSKGANGVVLIKTKRAKNMATEISADISLSYRAPFKSVPMMDASAYRLYVSDLMNGMYDDPTMLDLFKFLEDDPSKSYYRANHNNTDWLDLINDGAITQNYGLNVTGGDETALYAFSMGYSKADGNIKNTNFDRLNVRFNSDIELIQNKFDIGVDFAFANANNDVLSDGMNTQSSPFYLALVKAPVYHPNQYVYGGGLSSILTDVDELGVGNPLALVENGVGEVSKYRLNINVSPTFKFNEKFKLGAVFGYSWDKLNEKSFIPDFGLPEIPLYNQIGEVYAISKNSIKEIANRQSSVYLDARLNWNILKETSHDLSAFGGYRFVTDALKSEYGEGHNTRADNITNISQSQANLRSRKGINESWRSMTWYLNADYAYQNRYLLNVIATADASSRFGKKADGALKLGGVSWAIYPSATAGWIVSSEKFMKDVDFINFLKLNVGYGLAGNDNILNYATRTYFNSVNLIGGATGLILGNIGNEKIKWETTSTARAGLDFSMFNNRWSVNTNFYLSKTKDLLTRKQLNEIAGLKYYWSNEGELENKGFEIATNVRVIDSRDIKLDFGAMIGHYKNKITSLPNGSFVTDVYGGQVLTEVGHAAGVFYGYKTQGVFASSADAASEGLGMVQTDGSILPFQAGDMFFEDVNNDKIIDEKDKQVIGDPNPDFYGNFNFSLNYKNFTMDALFTYSYGNEAYNAFRANLEGGSSIHNQAESMQNRWVIEGQQASIPRAIYGDPMGNSRFSDRWIEDASYLKFKSLSLTYKVPLNLTFIQGFSVWGSVTNLITFSKYLGNDPEFSAGTSVLYQGIDAGMIPSTRSFNIGVKINL